MLPGHGYIICKAERMNLHHSVKEGIKLTYMDLGHGSVVQLLTHMHETLGLSSNVAKQNKNSIHRK
jgi:hypothetical protein